MCYITPHYTFRLKLILQVGVEEAVQRLQAHAGEKYALLKRRQIKDELGDIGKRAPFERRPVLSLLSFHFSCCWAGRRRCCREWARACEAQGAL